jgi:hypothetical protein
MESKTISKKSSKSHISNKTKLTNNKQNQNFIKNDRTFKKNGKFLLFLEYKNANKNLNQKSKLSRYSISSNNSLMFENNKFLISPIIC